MSVSEALELAGEAGGVKVQAVTNCPEPNSPRAFAVFPCYCGADFARGLQRQERVALLARSFNPHQPPWSCVSAAAAPPWEGGKR